MYKACTVAHALCIRQQQLSMFYAYVADQLPMLYAYIKQQLSMLYAYVAQQMRTTVV
jgi:hypothetical protein